MRAALGLLAVALLALAAVVLVQQAGLGGAPAKPSSVDLDEYLKIGADRSFKCDLIEELPSPPQVAIFGGSRAMRFEPQEFKRLTGLSAFNAALHNFHFEDAWAISNYLFSRSPDTRVSCFIALQSNAFSDAPMAPGLLYDSRLSEWFPKDLIAQQKEKAGEPKVSDLLQRGRYTPRGLLLWNTYDDRVEKGKSLEQVLDEYTERLLPRAADSGPVEQERSLLYFEKTVRLFNEHGAAPVVVIMPYHPRVLQAFREVGWQTKVDGLHETLADARTRLDFEVVDMMEIDAFGGDADEFYDGAHVTAANSRLIIREVVETVPQCFR